MDILHQISASLTKNQPKIIYGARVEVDAYTHWAENPVDLLFVL